MKAAKTLGRFRKPPLKNVEAAGERVFQDVFIDRESARLAPRMDEAPVQFRNSRLPVVALALAMLVVVLTLTPAKTLIWQPKEAAGIAEDTGTGTKLAAGEKVRAADGAISELKLADGSLIEMQAGSELFLERGADGVRIHLNDGAIIVTAAKQRTGHLYVQTKDVTVSVVGTIFLVMAEQDRSRVGVMEGIVDVDHRGALKRLQAGEQFSTNPPATSLLSGETVSWSRHARQYVALLGQFAALGHAEESAVHHPEFEVTSIRRSKSDQPSLIGGEGRGRYRATNVPIVLLIRMAYGIDDYQLVGAPDWISSERYDIEAKMDGSESQEQGLLLQEMLKDRFKLKVHGEAKEVSVYFLVPSKGGPKVKAGPCTPQDPNAPIVRGPKQTASCGFSGVTDFSLLATSIDATRLADLLSGILERRVLDKSGLSGRFDVDLSFRPDDLGPENSNGPFANLPSIFVALEEHLGLKLQTGRAPIDALVIDHIERPSEN